MSKVKISDWQGRQVTSDMVRRVVWLKKQTNIVNHMLELGWKREAWKHADGRVCGTCYHQNKCNPEFCLFAKVHEKVFKIMEADGTFNN